MYYAVKFIAFKVAGACYNLQMKLAELHAHVFMDGIDYKNSVERFKSGIDEQHIHAVFSSYKQNGIDFVRDGGDHFGACLYAKSIASEYEIKYIMPAFAIYKEGNYGKVVGKAYNSFHEYKQLIDKAREAGADFIKIMVSGILDFNQFGKVSKTNYSEDEVKELVHVAHEEGFSVMAHASGKEEVRKAALAGADSIEHGYYVDDEALDIMKEKNIVWVPTAVTSENLKGTRRFNEESVNKISLTHQEAIFRAMEKHVHIGIGSDAGAFNVLHAKGCKDEYELLRKILGDETDEILEVSTQIIKTKFAKLNK